MQNCPEETPGVFAWLFCFRKERWIMYDVLVIGGGSLLLTGETKEVQA